MQNLMSRNINNTKYKTLVMLAFGNILIKFGKNISNFFLYIYEYFCILKLLFKIWITISIV